jgi:ATP-dependent DNA helicase RecG
LSAHFFIFVDYCCNLYLYMPAKDENISPLQYIKGVGPRRAKALAAEGITEARDLVEYFPRAYIDRNAAASLKSLKSMLRQYNLFRRSVKSDDFKLQSEVGIVATVSAVSEHRIGRGRNMLSITLSDSSGGKAKIIFWNQVQFYSRLYSEGDLLSISGKPELDRYGVVTFHHPEIEKIDEEDRELYQSGKILPKYRITQPMRKAGITIRFFRNIISKLIDEVASDTSETFPQWLREKYEYMPKDEAIRQLHFPDSSEALQSALRRMKFEELFYYELKLAIRKRETRRQIKGIGIDPKSRLARKLYDSLPFELTGDQKKALREFAADFESDSPMNRLLQGDVGSGKTIVAVLTMLMAVDDGYQVAMMAPTEILAEQHFATLQKMLDGFDIGVALLTGGQKQSARKVILENIESGTAKIIVGTHAMFQSDIKYNNLALIIIDEQHRFGVAQRAELKKHAEQSTDGSCAPHILVMSATPIPRTLSLTLYGDLDVSVIKQMPKNRKPVRTKVAFESQLAAVHDFIKDELGKGRQTYIVYPLVEKSDKLELKAATQHFEKLSGDIFEKYRCGLLHGQMKWQEKEETMREFKDKKYDLLVSTTVIEVGIDVPNATIMLIENAERFGLAQLHQLRGRVGRGSEQSYCILMTKDNFKYQFKNKAIDEQEKAAAIIRLRTMEETTDGFKIAEVDMKLRGPGDILGTKQSGIPEFKFVDLVRDVDLIAEARNEAFDLIETDPHLRSEENQLIRETFLHGENSESFIDIA